jgi:hypothetical protein
LSYKLCHLPPRTPVSRASSMRSVQTSRSTQPQRVWIEPPCSSVCTLGGCWSFVLSLTHSPSYLPLLHARYGASQLIWRFCHPSLRSARMVEIPDSRHLNFSVVLSPYTRCRSMSAFFALASFRVLDSPRRAVSRLHPSRFWASPLASRLATTSGRIEFLSYGPTDSPPVALHPTFGGHNFSFPR